MEKNGWCCPVPSIYWQITKFHSSFWLNKISLHINTTFSFYSFILYFYVLFIYFCLFGLIFKKKFFLLCGSTLWQLQKFLQYIKYIMLEFIPSIIFLYLLFHPSVLRFCERKKKNDIFTCLRELHRELPCDTSMYICIIAQFDASLLFLFFLP
jgi:hypothetical protein